MFVVKGSTQVSQQEYPKKCKVLLVLFDKLISLTSKNLSSDFRKTHAFSAPLQLRLLLSLSPPLIKVLLTVQVIIYFVRHYYNVS